MRWPTARRSAWRSSQELEKSGELEGYYLLPATRADLLRRLGRFADAAAGYREALLLAPADAERRYLTAQAGERRRRATRE